jgi:hypothetical protein
MLFIFTSIPSNLHQENGAMIRLPPQMIQFFFCILPSHSFVVILSQIMMCNPSPIQSGRNANYFHLLFIFSKIQVHHRISYRICTIDCPLAATGCIYKLEMGTCMVNAPPSTFRITPVVQEPALLEKKMAAPAMSSSSPILPSGMLLAIDSLFTP